MQWRVLMALGLIGLILFGGLFCRENVADRCDQVADLLRQVQSQLEGDDSPSPEILEQAMALWEKNLPVLSALLSHDRLENVGRDLSRGLGYLHVGDRPGCLAQIDAALYLLDDIREYDHVDWKTLF